MNFLNDSQPPAHKHAIPHDLSITFTDVSVDSVPYSYYLFFCSLYYGGSFVLSRSTSSFGNNTKQF